MCKYLSCIIRKDKTVLILNGEDSHSEILEHFGISDLTDDPDKMEFARIELVPTCIKDAVEFRVEKWEYTVDQRIQPTWLTSAHEESVRASVTSHLVEFGYGGYLYLSDYNHPLPSEFTHCGGDLYLLDRQRLSLNDVLDVLPEGEMKESVKGIQSMLDEWSDMYSVKEG